MEEDFQDDVFEPNDIPEGMARLEALRFAVETAPADDPYDAILRRASAYYSFLTTNRTKRQYQ